MGDWEDLEAATKRYVAELNAFLEHHHELRRVMRSGIVPDHVAVKAHNSQDYDERMERYHSLGKVLGIVLLDERRLAFLELKTPLRTSIGLVGRLEIMEPREGTTGPEGLLIDHFEYFLPDYSSIRKAQREDRFRYDREHADTYNWLAISFGKGQELRFASKPSSAIIAEHHL